ncbi:MAG: DegV family protein [Clostridia bacterium]|nr:DegV family protein [Clostridia bacterium]
MSQYVLSCCSTADLSKEHFERRNIEYICFHYYLDGVQYPDDLGQTISFADFYKAMENGAQTKTSQINATEYLAYFTKYLEQGKDLLHVSLSSGLSGSVQSAHIAAEMAREQFPDRRIEIVDSLAAASGYGLLMDRLADLRDEGYSLDQLKTWAEENRKKLHHWFFTTDLTYFVRGGRVSKVSGFVGGALNLCPLLNVSHEGKLVARKKCIGKKKVISEIVARMVESADDRLDYNGKCYLCHSACYDDAKIVADLVEAKFPNLDGKPQIYDIGTTIGSHTGPGTVALFFWGDERQN